MCVWEGSCRQHVWSTSTVTEGHQSEQCDGVNLIHMFQFSQWKTSQIHIHQSCFISNTRVCFEVVFTWFCLAVCHGMSKSVIFVCYLIFMRCSSILAAALPTIPLIEYKTWLYLFIFVFSVDRLNRDANTSGNVDRQRKYVKYYSLF